MHCVGLKLNSSTGIQMTRAHYSLRYLGPERSVCAGVFVLIPCRVRGRWNGETGTRLGDDGMVVMCGQRLASLLKVGHCCPPTATRAPTFSPRQVAQIYTLIQDGLEFLPLPPGQHQWSDLRVSSQS